MSNKSENDSNRLNQNAFISATAFDPNLIGPTFSSIPPYTLPTGATGSTGPTGDTG
ncbi:exosporium leader peptide-containing protein, partial [Bacillus toyonensis]